MGWIQEWRNTRAIRRQLWLLQLGFYMEENRRRLAELEAYDGNKCAKCADKGAPHKKCGAP